MPLRIIEAHATRDAIEAFDFSASKHGAIETWYSSLEGKDRILYSALVFTNSSQALIDALQAMPLNIRPTRLLLRPVEATLPRPEPKKEENDEDAPRKQTFSGISREELYARLASGAQLDNNFILLATLATIVASIGLISDNVAVVIGAMVIAPLLGPNLALALATAIADAELLKRAIRTNLAGLALTLFLSILIGIFWPANINSHELMSRTFVGFDSIILALASGAAAVLSLTTGVSTVLVGVMVAVALLPPAATFGMLIGNGDLRLAIGAGLLLAVNIVCVNLAAKLVLQFKRISPYYWYKKQKARSAMKRSMAIWLVTLVILGGLIYLYGQFINVHTPSLRQFVSM